MVDDPSISYFGYSDDIQLNTGLAEGNLKALINWQIMAAYEDDAPRSPSDNPAN